MTSLLLALLLAAAPPAGTAAPPSLAVAEAAVPAEAWELAELLNPEQETIDVTWRGFVVGFQTALKADAEQSQFFARNPGLEDAIFKAVRPLVERSVRQALPRSRAGQARFFAGSFSADELQQLLGFYRTPTGTKLIAGMYAGVDLQQLASRVQQSEAQQVTPSDIRALGSGAVRRVLPAFTADDRAALIRFAGTPVFPKLRRLLPEIAKRQAEEANSADPELDTVVTSAIERAVQDYLASHEQPDG